MHSTHYPDLFQGQHLTQPYYASIIQALLITAVETSTAVIDRWCNTKALYTRQAYNERFCKMFYTDVKQKYIEENNDI